ncbi:MAG: K+-dependent Na+/Ca+ exchanger family protein [Candidatus Collierbacteria bacterium GW2011_GWB1_44_6]|uniref:K+-dependent Na+/Ca+ exchanger family protein n=1 Tax=Candidatus Collierbacteria bacterium GW2011_GWB1_44_6 TaxID=1618384 RepID=A0A0G1JN40_9BACT|nr:MAG: K+-dependent Na+/Ca+ exchanger family protein [Candidatus Collierbacteria bacterium GW2011_GWB1_44_6]KKT83655.1 MAG: K+-dependent Na+/Ca+ exchanger family protein [Microgenomates group bacterium GW2011_GWC1_44_9]
MWLNDSMVFDILGGMLLIVLMVIASGVAVEIFEKIAHEVKVSKLLLATILVGFSTSLPELFVGITSAIKGQPLVSFGDIVGANLANLSWIIGGAAIVSGTIPVIGEYLKKDLWIAMSVTIFPFFLMIDGVLSRLDGVILILIYLLYVSDLVHSGNSLIKHAKLAGRHIHHRLKTEINWGIQGLILVIALAVLGASAWALVNLAVRISLALGVSVFWVGLLVVAVGTTLPELILSIFASRKREIALILGNILGSVVVNSTLILGIVAIISPIEFVESPERLVAGISLLVVMGLFWLFTRSKHKLERWEGVVLVGIYVMFVGIQLLLA